MTHHTTWLDSLITHPEGIHKDYAPNKTRRTYEERLNRMQKILEVIGNPQRAYKAVHITGTSGKGSVATMTAALLQQSSHTVGLHTSPYLQLPTEKIQLNGSQIDMPLFKSYITALRKMIAYTNPTYGQAWTALVHLVFREEPMEWGVCEARMGGRYDETNLINSRVSVITTVDYDHVKQLGPHLTDIAWHKAGIIKHGMPSVTGVTNPKLLAVMQAEAKEKNSDLYCFGEDFTASDVVVHDQGITATIATPFGTYSNLYINLSGRYQAQNAACALMAAQLALQGENKKLQEANVRQAFKTVQIPGRFEIMQQQPLCVLDGAHNPAKMEALSELIAQRYHHKAITLLVGVLESKDTKRTIAPILPYASRIIVSEPHVKGKLPLSAQQLTQVITSMNSHIPVTIVKEPLKALVYALKNIDNTNSMLLVTGSLYLVGNIREHWHPT
ncbi:MAG: Mur ligase family protein [Candidatus Roizmanbacteria bacterium]|nr:Mur ligase family protein [Candidatus Roizmanbacteria bacterium]